MKSSTAHCISQFLVQLLLLLFIGQRAGSVTVVRETSSRRGGGGRGTGQFEGRFTAQGGGASTSDAGTVVNLITETVPVS